MEPLQKAKYALAFQRTENGGLRIPHAESYVLANRASWTKRVFDENKSNSAYLKTHTPDVNLVCLFKCNYNPEDLPTEMPLVYKQVYMHGFI